MGGADKAYPLDSPSVFQHIPSSLLLISICFVRTGCPQVGHRRDRPSEVRVPPGGRRGVSETVSLVGGKLLRFYIDDEANVGSKCLRMPSVIDTVRVFL